MKFDLVVYVNDVPLEDDYILDVTKVDLVSNSPREKFVCLGDNGNIADDSRYAV